VFDLHGTIMMIHSEALKGVFSVTTADGQNIDSQSKHEDIIEIKPNFCGIGLNLNALIRKIFKIVAIKWLKRRHAGDG